MAKPQTTGLLSTLLVCLQSCFAHAVSPAQPSRPDCYIPCGETNCGFSIICTWDSNQVFHIPTNYTLHWEPTNSRVGYVISRTNSSGVIPREHFSSHSDLRVWVRAINQDGSAKSLDAEFNTNNIKKPLPPKVTVSQQDLSEVYWNSPCDQLHFSLGSCDVRHRTEGGVWEEHNGFHNMYTFENLQPCTTYEVQIRCVCDIALMSDWSESHNVQGTETAPVGELDVWRDCGTFPPSTNCVLTWKRLPASQAWCGLILGYEVQLSYNNGTVAFRNVSTAEARCDEVQCKFSCSLKDASSVSVSAYNAHGTTVPSYLALPFPGQEGDKQFLSLKMNEENLTVSWNTTFQLSDNLKEYVLEYKQTGSPQGQGLDWIKVSNRTTAIIKGHFQNYISYEVSLFAITHSNKAHRLSSVTAYSLQRTPSKVPTFKVPFIAATHVELHWETVPKQDGMVWYQIEVDGGHSGSPQVYNVSASPLQGYMTFPLQHLNPGQRYEVWIRAVSEAGPGEKATTSFKTKDQEGFAHWSILPGILFAVVIVAVFILYCVFRGENRDHSLVCFYEKVPDPRNSHIFRQMKHQINDRMSWICIPTYEPHPKISILEVVDTKLLGSKSSLEKTSEAGGFKRPVIRQESSQMNFQADQREDAVMEDCQRKDNKCGREAYSKMIDSDEEGGREEEEDREGCWSSSEEEQCTIGYEKHFMPTASDILEVS